MLDGHMRQIASEVNKSFYWTKKALVTSYDPDTHKAKVKLVPENIETGWLQIGTMMSGNGFGVTSGLIPNQEVAVHFENANLNGGIIGAVYYADEDPVRTEPGEFKIVHESGSFIKMFKDGTIEIKANKDLILKADEDLILSSPTKIITNTTVIQNFVTSSIAGGNYNASLHIDHED